MENPKKIRFQTFLRLIKYLKSYLILLIITVILSVVSVALLLNVPVLCGKAIDEMNGAGAVRFSSLYELLTKTVICACLYSILQWVINTLSNQIAFSVIRDVRADAFNTIIKLPLSYVDSHMQGDIVSRVISDVDAFADGLLLGFTQLFTGIITIVMTIIIMFRYQPLIAVTVVLLTPLSLVISSYIARKTFNMFRTQAEISSDMTAYINETIGNQAIIRAFSMEKSTISKFEHISINNEKASIRAIFYSSLTNPSTRFINNVVYASVCLTGALSAVNGSMTVGGLLSVLTLTTQYSRPFNEITSVISELQHALACAERVFTLIDEQRELEDDEEAIDIKDIVGAVSIEHVDFSYNHNNELIHDLSLNVKPGERIAIVGPTGCGKTTLINLLMRFYDIDSGRITVDCNDIRSITRKSLRRAYGMVLQDTWLIHDTVLNNIKLGRDFSDEAVIAAAKASYADSFIRRLPNGYDTVIDEDCGMLSAGQRQQLCIARVMLDIPPMLILDEATSSIDTRTEMKIQHAFATMMQGRTSFIVAHRLPTVKHADMILVMNNGKIIERGSHNELIQGQSFYSELWNA